MEGVENAAGNLPMDPEVQERFNQIQGQFNNLLNDLMEGASEIFRRRSGQDDVNDLKKRLESTVQSARREEETLKAQLRDADAEAERLRSELKSRGPATKNTEKGLMGQESFGQIEKMREELHATQTVMESQQKEHAAAIKALQGKLNALREEHKDLETNYEEVKKELGAAAKGSGQSKKGTTQKAQAKEKQKNDDLALYQAMYKKTKGELDETKGELDKVKGELDKVKGKLDKVKGKLNRTKTNYENVYHHPDYLIETMQEMTQLFFSQQPIQEFFESNSQAAEWKKDFVDEVNRFTRILFVWNVTGKQVPWSMARRTQSLMYLLPDSQYKEERSAFKETQHLLEARIKEKPGDTDQENKELAGVEAFLSQVLSNYVPDRFKYLIQIPQIENLENAWEIAVEIAKEEATLDGITQGKSTKGLTKARTELMDELKRLAQANGNSEEIQKAMSRFKDRIQALQNGGQ